MDNGNEFMQRIPVGLSGQFESARVLQPGLLNRSPSPAITRIRGLGCKDRGEAVYQIQFNLIEFDGIRLKADTYLTPSLAATRFHCDKPLSLLTAPLMKSILR